MMMVPGRCGGWRAAAALVGLLAFVAPWRLLHATSDVSRAGTTGNASPQSTVATGVSAWNAVSVKPCSNNRGRGGLTLVAPSRLTINCQPVTGLIATAYLVFEQGQAHAFYASGANGTIVEGGPAWVRADRYTVNATAEGTPTKTVMQGPMMQTVLEERFKLKVHRETRDVPVYNLVVDRRGSKLVPFTPGRCVPLDMAREDFIVSLAPGERRCDSIAYFDGPILHMDAEGTTLEDFAKGFLVGAFLDRRIVNRTGLTGRYDIHLTFAPAVSGIDPGAVNDPAAPSIHVALREQLGLRLESAKGTGEYLVIDHIEHPTED
jgi:uncharacterized protein (TIGR03435 family)